MTYLPYLRKLLAVLEILSDTLLNSDVSELESKICAKTSFGKLSRKELKFFDSTRTPPLTPSTRGLPLSFSPLLRRSYTARVPSPDAAP